MRRFIFCLGVILLLSSSAEAQISDDISEDSVKSLLCHKWGYRAIIMGGQEMTNFKETVTYEFQKDYSFQRVSSSGKSEKGKWAYDRAARLITLKIKKTTLFVVKLKLGDLVVSPNKIEEKDGNTLGIATALKLIEE